MKFSQKENCKILSNAPLIMYPTYIWSYKIKYDYFTTEQVV